MTRWGLVFATLLGLALGLAVSPPTGAAQAAGEVSDLVPKVSLSRAQAKAEAKVADPLFVQDVLETAKRARARLKLLDGSIVNLGPRTRFLVVEMSQASQRTSLELTYGRLRADVSRRTQPGGQFTVKTHTAALGVIGTTAFVAASAEQTVVANLSADPTARIWVRSSDPAITETVILTPGHGTRVARQQPPRPPRLWSKEEIALAKDDTREFKP